MSSRVPAPQKQRTFWSIQNHQVLNRTNSSIISKHYVKEGIIVNPFTESGPELITLDTGKVMDPAIADCLRKAPNIGKAKFTEFVTKRIEKADKPLSLLTSSQESICTYSTTGHLQI